MTSPASYNPEQFGFAHCKQFDKLTVNRVEGLYNLRIEASIFRLKSFRGSKLASKLTLLILLYKILLGLRYKNMELSLFLAKAWGLYITIMLLVLLFRKDALHRLLNSIQDANTVLVYSFMALIIGILSILSHNVWTTDWRVLITLFGWASFIKGLTLFIHPEYSLNVLKTLKIKRQGGGIYIYLIIGLILGIYLLYSGFSY